MNLKKTFRLGNFSKFNIVLALQVLCLTTSLVAGETAVNFREPNISKFPEVHLKDAKKSDFNIGYELDFMSDRKQILSGPDCKISFSKSKGYFHGPKLGFSGDPISGYVKIGRANYSFKDPDMGNYKGFGFGVGGQATVYNQDDLSVAVELAYFGGRATNNKFDFSKIEGFGSKSFVSISESARSPGEEYIHVPELRSRVFEMAFVDENGELTQERVRGLENGDLVDPYNTVIGFRDANDNWFINTKFVDLESGQHYSRNEKFQIEKFPVSNLAKMKQSLITARLIAKKKIGDFSPFIGIGYTSDKTTFSEKSKISNYASKKILKGENKNKIGPFVGCNFANSDKLYFGFEAQILNRNSFNFSGSYSF